MMPFPARVLRTLTPVAAAALLCACNSIPSASNPAPAGRIVDTRTNSTVSRDELLRRAVASRYVILGEAHDNPEHHRLQAEVLAAMLRAGRAPALAMEQFDREHQPALDAAFARGERDAARIAEAGRFERRSWQWPHYEPLVALAAQHQLRIVAANVSREQARALIRSGRTAGGLAPVTPSLRDALSRDIIEGHCGLHPGEAMLSGMIEAQRARDAQMAKALETAGPGGAVLIAGAAHARRDRGVPQYLSGGGAADALVIGFVEVDAGGEPPVRGEEFDLVWFTPRAAREDPCAGLRLPGAGANAPRR